MKISIESPIGGGKSTLINVLQTYFENIHFIKEPIDQWVNMSHETNIVNFLSEFYKNPSKYGSLFQVWSTLSKSLISYNFNPTDIVITERSPATDQYCFTEILHKDNIIDNTEYIVLQNFFKWIKANQFQGYNYIIYLQTEPNICFERILKRNRLEENNISFEYIKKIHKVHEDWLNDRTNRKDIIIINGDEEFEDDEPRQKEIISCLIEHLPCLKNCLKEKYKGYFENLNGWKVVNTKKHKANYTS